MNSSLLSNINSEELTNENLLTNRPNCVHVLVEDEDDARFWNDLLHSVLPEKQFEVSPYQRTTTSVSKLVKGKQHILNDTSVYGKNYIACVDSDYDYVLAEYSPYKEALQSPFVYQTCAYSCENLLCEPSTLSEVCFKCTTCSTTYDFAGFCNKLSHCLYPLLSWTLFLISSGHESDLLLSEMWKSVLPCDKGMDKQTEQQLLDKVAELVQEKITSFQAKYPYSQETVNQFIFEFQKSFRLTPNMSFLYVRGHDLFEYILNVLIKPECLKLKNQHKQTIKAHSINPLEIENLLNHYQSCCRDCEETLRDNFMYKEKSSLMQTITDKIRKELC